jgi:hypothetical protein
MRFQVFSFPIVALPIPIPAIVLPKAGKGSGKSLRKNISFNF